MDTDTRDAHTPRHTDPDDDAAVEMSGGRRAILTLVVLVLLLSIGVSVAPPSVLRDDLTTIARPVLLSTGLDQSWGVFAPNPQRVSTSVTARVVRADGTSRDYAIPHGRGIDAYWDYRWLKYGDQIAEDRKTDDERTAFALWAVGQDREAGGSPVRVVLIRHAQELLPPGPGPDDGRPEDVPIYAATVEGPR